MNISKLCTIILAVTASGFASPRLAQLTERAEFYYGEVAYSSGDGKNLYGKSLSLVKRVVSPARREILETVLQPSLFSGEKPAEFITHLVREGSPAIFRAFDDGQTFSGQVAFSGPEWNWTDWTYAIVLKDGGRIEGTGSRSSEGIRTLKKFSGPGGSPVTLIQENLGPITAERYQFIRNEMLSKK